MTLSYPIASNAAHPAHLSPGYRSSIKRAFHSTKMILSRAVDFGSRVNRPIPHGVNPTRVGGKPVGASLQMLAAERAKLHNDLPLRYAGHERFGHAENQGNSETSNAK